MKILAKPFVFFIVSVVLVSCYTSERVISKSNSPEKYQSFPLTDVTAITTPYEGKVYTAEEVSEMTRFPACEDQSIAVEELKSCADKEMLRYIYSNIKYPAIARENGVQGTVVIEFVVTPQGRIRSAKIARDPGAQTGNSAMDIIANMDRSYTWKPAMVDGKAVAVLYKLPVKYKLL